MYRVIALRPGKNGRAEVKQIAGPFSSPYEAEEERRRALMAKARDLHDSWNYRVVRDGQVTESKSLALIKAEELVGALSRLVTLTSDKSEAQIETQTALGLAENLVSILEGGIG